MVGMCPNDPCTCKVVGRTRCIHFDERAEFEKAWAKRPWLLEEESDKDRAWRWWMTRAELPLTPA